MRGSRANGTSAEDTLWFQLRDRHLGGFKFLRQFPIEQYFVDFACREQRLIVEIDGGTHGTQTKSPVTASATNAHGT
ncbi:DUF559 domain-containing protein [Hyphomicrobium sp.]|uniref:endonuclease domain-containing protein n=1 Tax=Hyphomicrobium sp. TaxID=82 RepID=UPI000FB0699B|nr:DUF559 domain-containing protein [Hyphomicrobium sp.]RUO98376.1 MAG: DUF559 domain-containing protein [Hyphomicrobium sp.]